MIVIHPEAAIEAQAARAWFSARSPAVGERFLAEYDRAIARIAESPGRWPEHPLIPGLRWFRFGRHRARRNHERMLSTRRICTRMVTRRSPGR
ncbi:MAG: hypothetical protein V2A73_09625, partial [Pseudomonadota bacterium]